MSPENEENAGENSSNSSAGKIEEEVPTIITREYLRELDRRVYPVIIDLQRNAQNSVADELNKLFSVCDNLSIQLEDVLAENEKLKMDRVDASGVIAHALKISAKDQDTLKILRRDLERAWRATDAANARDESKDETLQAVLKKYEALVKKTKAQEMEMEPEEIAGLGKFKDTVVFECERLTAEVFELNKRLLIQRHYSDALTKKVEESENNFKDLYKKLDDLFNESFKEKKELERLKLLHDVLLGEKVILEDNLQHYMTRSDDLNKELNLSQDRFANIKEALGKRNAENLLCNDLVKKSELEVETWKNIKKEIAFELKQTKIAMSLNDDYQKKLVFESQKKVKEIESLSKKIILVENSKGAVEQQVLILKNDKITVIKERDLANKYNEEQKKKIERQVRSIDLLQKELEKSTKTIQEFKDIKSFLEEASLQLKKEIKKHVALDRKSKNKIKAHSKRIGQLHLEKEFFKEEVEIQKVEVKIRDEDIEKIKKEMESCVQELQELKEMLVSQQDENKRTNLVLNTYMSREEDLKNRYISTKYQVEELTENVTIKKREIMLLSRENRKFEDKIKELKRDLEKSQVSLKKAQEELVEIRLENKKYLEALRVDEEKFVSQKNELLKTLREKDLLSSQILRKTDEVSSLQQENTLLKTNNDEANSFVNEKLADIRLLTIEVNSLQSQCKLLKGSLISTVDMRHEVLQLNRKLTQEQVKSTALTEIMNTPQNIHRWRKLGCMDPKKMDLVFKCQRLTKSLLVKTNKLIKIEKILKSYHEKFAMLEQTVINKPNQAVLVKLNKARSELTNNTKKMKAAVAISRANLNDLGLKDNIIDQLQREIEVLKTQLFKEKKEKFKLLLQKTLNLNP